MFPVIEEIYDPIHSPRLRNSLLQQYQMGDSENSGKGEIKKIIIVIIFMIFFLFRHS